MIQPLFWTDFYGVNFSTELKLWIEKKAMYNKHLERLRPVAVPIFKVWPLWDNILRAVQASYDQHAAPSRGIYRLAV